MIFLRLDVDRFPELGERFEIKTVPTFILYNHGEIIDQIVGVTPKDELERRAQKFLEKH